MRPTFFSCWTVCLRSCFGRGETMTGRRALGPLYAGTFQIIQAASPPALTSSTAKGSSTPKIWKGIYQLNRETLTICDNTADLEKGPSDGVRGQGRFCS